MATSFTTLLDPVTPTITSPTASQTNVERNPTVTSSAFSSNPGLTHTSSDWQIATDSGFSSVVWSKATDTTNKTSIVVNTTNGTFAGVLLGLTQLTELTGYYVRVRYTDSEGTSSAYSTGVYFETRAALVTFNSETVKEYPKGIVDVQKPGMTATAEATPVAARTDGSLRIDLLTNRFYWRSNSAWFYSSGALLKATVQTTTYTAVPTVDVVVCNAAGGFTLSLPPATGSGKLFHIKNINTGAIVIDGDSGDTIDGETTQSMNQWDSISIIDYLANKWIII
jgi:hypothetical protein